MNNEFQTYQQLAMRTAKRGDTEFDLRHAAYGLAGEAGEFADCMKRHQVYDQDFDADNAAEEIGDILWYCALAASALGISLDEIAARNIDKLRKRYPVKYQDELAAFRADKQREIEA